MSETLRCPFCGSIPKIESKFEEFTLYWVVCSNMECRVALCMGESNILDAIAKWNGRFEFNQREQENLATLLVDIYAVATGEKQVGSDDTDGLEYIAHAIRAESIVSVAVSSKIPLNAKTARVFERPQLKSNIT